MVQIIIGILVLVAILLLCPVRYEVEATAWQLKISVRFLGGLWTVERYIPSKNKKEKEQSQEHEESCSSEKQGRPSFEEQCEFAYEEGVWSKFGQLIYRLWIHSRPRYGEIKGVFGTGDPGETGMLSGWCAAFFPKVTRGIIWTYTEAKNELQGCMGGRVIPLYVLILTLEILSAPEIRRFLKYRKGQYHVSGNE